MKIYHTCTIPKFSPFEIKTSQLLRLTHFVELFQNTVYNTSLNKWSQTMKTMTPYKVKRPCEDLWYWHGQNCCVAQLWQTVFSSVLFFYFFFSVEDNIREQVMDSYLGGMPYIAWFSSHALKSNMRIFSRDHNHILVRSFACCIIVVSLQTWSSPITTLIDHWSNWWSPKKFYLKIFILKHQFTYKS